MDRIRKWLRRDRPSAAAYEPVPADSLGSSIGSLNSASPPISPSFSWIDYVIFTLLGVAMLWAWNMFLVAAPYFHGRFANSQWLLNNFQPAILTVFNGTNVVCSWVLAKMQHNASYPRRITVAMTLSMVATTLLAISTTFDTSAELYFVFLMIMVHIASLSTGFCGNGLLAFASSFGDSEYTQAIMTGQGIAGVLPSIVQIVAVLSVPEIHVSQEFAKEDPRSAFAYFITATIVVGTALLAFLYLLRRHPDRAVVKSIASDDEVLLEESARNKVVGMLVLLRKLQWFALGVTVTFVVTMVFPVFTQAILSVQDPTTAPRIFQPSAFIPLAFLVWNTGDLIGRTLPLWPRISGINFPRTIFFAAVARVLFVPLYELCNIKGRGAVVPSDAFYLGVVQLFFGLTSGYVGSTCMMAAGHWVEPEERQAAGGFMSLMLVVGLAIGSLLSFLVVPS